MSEDRMTPSSTPNDPIDGRLSRYLDWESRQVAGAPVADVAASIAGGSIARRSGPTPALVWAALLMALVVIGGAIAFAGRQPQLLVVAPSNEASVVPTTLAVTDAPATERPATELPATEPPATELPATEPPVTEGPDPNCIQFDGEATYTANVGTLPVSLTVPATPGSPWQGLRDRFFLGKASCDRDAEIAPYFHAALVGRVYADACHWKTSLVEVPTAFDAVEALSRDSGPTKTKPVATTLGAFRATRLDINVPADFDDSACDEGFLGLWPGLIIIPGVPIRVYIAEIDGTTLGITASYDPALVTPADIESIDSVLASLRVDM